MVALARLTASSLVSERLEAEHGPEELVLDERRVECFGLEHRRTKERAFGEGRVSRAAPAYQYLGELRRSLDDPLEPSHGSVIDERPHLARLLVRRAKHHSLKECS